MLCHVDLSQNRSLDFYLPRNVKMSGQGSDEEITDLTVTESARFPSLTHAESEGVNKRSVIGASVSNVYTPLLSGTRLLVSSPAPSTNAATSSSDPSTDSLVQRQPTKTSLTVVPHRPRGPRSAVRPFFCCGSELSLVSLVDGLELKDGCGRGGLNIKNIECSESSSEEEELTQRKTVASGATNRSIVRRKKKDKLSAKKKFWSLRFRGRWNTRWRVSQSQRSGSHRIEQSHRSSPTLSQGTNASSPGTSRRPFINCGSYVDGNGHLVPIPNFEQLYPTEDIDSVRLRERAEEMANGVELQRNLLLSQDFHTRGAVGLSQSVADMLHQTRHLGLFNSESNFPLPESPAEEDYSLLMNNFMLQLQSSRNGGLCSETGSKPGSPRIYTQVDYIHCLVPQLSKIMGCPFYWGIMDRYEAERLLDSKPEGTFLLRDSAQEDFLFSVSFRRYNRSLHARVEQWNHRFSFDAHDPCVYSAASVCELMEHYKDPSSCMFFEPMLTRPLPRNFTFSLQHICRAIICDTLEYDQIHELPIPNSLKQFLQAYHYKQKVRVRHFDGSGMLYT